MEEEKKSKNTGEKVGIIFIILLIVVAILVISLIIVKATNQKTEEEKKVETQSGSGNNVAIGDTYIAIEGYFLGKYENGQWKSVESYYETDNYIKNVDKDQKPIVQANDYTFKQISSPEKYYLSRYGKNIIELTDYIAIGDEDYFASEVMFETMDSDKIQILTSEKINAFPFKMSDSDLENSTLISKLKTDYNIPNANLEVTMSYKTNINGVVEKYYCIETLNEGYTLELDDEGNFDETYMTEPVGLFLVREKSRGNYEVIYHYVVTEEEAKEYSKTLTEYDEMDYTDIMIYDFVICDLNGDNNPEICLENYVNNKEEFYVFSLEGDKYEMKLFGSF